jgi:hypothetical protein
MSDDRPHAAIPRAAGPGPFPLSAAQRGAWVRQTLDPGQIFYNVFRILEFTGPLQPDRLERALAGWVARHDVLRTTFSAAADAEDEPRAHVATAPVALPVVDLAPLGDEERADELHRRVRSTSGADRSTASGSSAPRRPATGCSSPSTTSSSTAFHCAR